MKGKILDFSIQDNTGMILGDNGLRYPFTGQQWKEQINPVRGTPVDFEVSADQQAIAIYIDAPVPAQSAPLNQAATESISKAATSAQQIFKQLDLAENSYQKAILNCFKKFADFKGRSARSEFWYFQLFCVLLSIFLHFISQNLASLAMLIVMLPNLAVSVRRMHDIGRSGWWVCIVAVPIVGVFLFLFWAIQDSDAETNAYGLPTQFTTE
jgi:uncharacterized membrane protein YhaH (DUF805 family)